MGPGTRLRSKKTCPGSSAKLGTSIRYSGELADQPSSQDSIGGRVPFWKQRAGGCGWENRDGRKQRAKGWGGDGGPPSRLADGKALGP